VDSASTRVTGEQISGLKVNGQSHWEPVRLIAKTKSKI